MGGACLVLGAIWAVMPAIEAQRLEGTWLAISQEAYGNVIVTSPSGTSVIPSKPGPQPYAIERKLILSRGSCLIKVAGVDVLEGKYTINALVTPKEFTIVLKLPDDLGTATVKAIYKTDGENLTLCMPAAGLPRPRAFVADPKGDNTVLRLKRQTKKPE